jgi:hypothetical protein
MDLLEFTDPRQKLNENIQKINLEIMNNSTMQQSINDFDLIDTVIMSYI